jgi:plasmid stabilization system protein ParE
MEIEWSPLAVERVLDLAEYIALDKPDIAVQWATDIFDSTEKLEDHPKIGRVVPEINDEYYRELIEGNYRVIYWLGASKISILTVCYSRKVLPLDEIK